MKSIHGRIGAVLLGALLLVSCASSRLHEQGVSEFEQGRYEIGLQKLGEAARSDPGNFSYRIDLQARREEAIQKLISEGDKARAAGDAAAAATAYRRVLSIQAGNYRAAKGLAAVEADLRHAQLAAEAQKSIERGDLDDADVKVRAMLTEDPGYAPATTLRAAIDAARGPVNATPRLRTRDDRPVTLQFRDAPTKMVFEVLSRQTGINFIFDKDIRSDGKTTIFVQDVPIEQAIDLVLGQNQLARQVLSENMVLIYPNTTAKQKDYQDQIVHTFYLNTATPKDVESLLKTVLDVKTLVVNERANAIVMRDTPEVVRMAEKLVASVDIAEPEVMLEVEVLEIARTRALQLGITYPNSVSLATPSGLVLNDLSGGSGSKINGNSISVSPLSVTVDALKTDGNSNVLASPRIRARNKEKAKILIGSRVPTITTAVTATGVGTQPIANTQVQYLDVGLTLDVEPTIYADNDVAIKLNLEVSSIVNTVKVGQTLAYEIGTRNATTLLQLKDGETQILGGLIKDSDTRSASKIPGFGDIPVIGRLFSDHNSNNQKSEVVMAITPHIIRAKARPSSDTTEFWFGTESRSGLAPLASGGKRTASAGPAAAGAALSPSNVNSMGADTSVGSAVVTGSASGAAPAAGGGMVEAPNARLAAITGVSAVPSARAAEPQGPAPKLSTTVSGPTEVKVGDEFTVTLQVETDQPINRARAQVRFDGSAFQLLGGDPGGAVPASSNAKVIGRSGGAQMDATPTSGDTINSGDLIVLKLKAVQARPQTAIAAQLSVMGSSGTIVASSTPTPLTISVGN